ncbi:MAG: hypothetical protein HY554_02450 [Elusimicrobia bacterium]|nr:hypothetical protein [Elusimicrobiota bacterium]
MSPEGSAKARPLADPAAWGLAALGLGLGLWGIGWGLPNEDRLRRVLPPEHRTEAFHRALADSWTALHRRLGQNLMTNPEAWSAHFSGVARSEAGWTQPPEVLANSLRSFFIRSEQEDEQSTLLALSRMRPRSLQFNPHLFVYGGTYVYSVGLCLAAGAAAGFVSLRPSLQSYLADPASMATLYLAGRLLSVAAFVASALLLLRIGRRHLDSAAGAVAGLLFLLTPGVIVPAHVLKVHMFWTVFGLLTLDKAVDVLRDGRLRDYAWAGAFAGLTVGACLMGWPACLIVACAGALRLARGGSFVEEGKGLVLSGAAAFGTALATNPYWALDFPSFSGEIRYLSGLSTFNLLNPWIFFSRAYWPAATGPIAALTIGGALLAYKRRGAEPALLLALCTLAAALAAMATNGNGVDGPGQVRYFLPWLAVGHLLAARLLVALWRREAPGRAWLRLGLASAVVHLGLSGFAYSRNFHEAGTSRSTHARSGEWIEANVPPGSTIGLLRMPQPSNSPFFRLDRYALVVIEAGRVGAATAGELPRFMILTLPYDLGMRDRLDRYALAASFEAGGPLPWIQVDPRATTANPTILIYRLKS